MCNAIQKFALFSPSRDPDVGRWPLSTVQGLPPDYRVPSRDEIRHCREAVRVSPLQPRGHRHQRARPVRHRSRDRRRSPKCAKFQGALDFVPPSRFGVSYVQSRSVQPSEGNPQCKLQNPRHVRIVRIKKVCCARPRVRIIHSRSTTIFCGQSVAPMTSLRTWSG